MNIAIFGSCVSRDTCEFIPGGEVIAYVARHSVTSLQAPHGTAGIDISGLNSPFQKRMVMTDLCGSGVEVVVERAKELDLVLLDLVDERRGYWLFPDGTTMTNSLEIEACGLGEATATGGARLVAFGTDEHFATWKHGFDTLIAHLRRSGLWEKTVFLDIEWAGAFEDSNHPQGGIIGRLGRRQRRIQRGTREALRSMSNGAGAAEAWSRMRHVKPTEAEEFADRAEESNSLYIRYREVARSLAAHVVRRSSKDLRIGRGHRWGPQPFHYRDEDYESIVHDVLDELKKVQS